MQCSRTLRALPVAVALTLAPLAAQTRYRVEVDGEWFHQEAGSRRLARLASGAEVRDAGERQGDWRKVTIEGWIFGRSVGTPALPGFDLAVTRDPEENLRVAPNANGALIARLLRGVQLLRVETRGGWVHVRREGWVRRQALGVVAAAATTRDTGTASAGGGDDVDAARARAARAATLYRAPDGAEAGQLAAETAVRVLSRGDEWSRVQLEGWVRTADLGAAPPGVLLGVTAAELRAEPQRYAGKVLRWELQYIARRTADELRPDIPSGAPYLLAKGPLPERGFVYVVVPDSLAGTVARLTPLSTATVTVRVRSGTSRHLGHPVVDLLALEVRR